MHRKPSGSRPTWEQRRRGTHGIQPFQIRAVASLSSPLCVRHARIRPRDVVRPAEPDQKASAELRADFVRAHAICRSGLLARPGCSAESALRSLRRFGSRPSRLRWKLIEGWPRPESRSRLGTRPVSSRQGKRWGDSGGTAAATLRVLTSGRQGCRAGNTRGVCRGPNCLRCQPATLNSGRHGESPAPGGEPHRTQACQSGFEQRAAGVRARLSPIRGSDLCGGRLRFGFGPASCESWFGGCRAILQRTVVFVSGNSNGFRVLLSVSYLWPQVPGEIGRVNCFPVHRPRAFPPRASRWPRQLTRARGPLLRLPGPFGRRHHATNRCV